MTTLRANTIYSSAATRVIAIESIECLPQKSVGFYRLYASIEAAALIVCGANQNFVVNLAPTEISLEEFEQRVPGLRSMLEEGRLGD